MIGQGLRDSARDQQNMNSGVAVNVKIPDFQHVIERLDKLKKMSDDMERRSKRVLIGMFGLHIEEEKIAEKVVPQGFVDTVMDRMEFIFENLSSMEQDMNKMCEELGINNEQFEDDKKRS